MWFTEIEWSEAIADKLWSKHRVELWEVEEALRDAPDLRRGPGEIHYVRGRTQAGRYLFIVVAAERGPRKFRLVSAREMTDREKRDYRQR